MLGLRVRGQTLFFVILPQPNTQIEVAEDLVVVCLGY